MIKMAIYQDSWYPVYGLWDLGKNLSRSSSDPISQFSEEEIVAIDAAYAEFEKWQNVLERRFRAQKDARDEV